MANNVKKADEAKKVVTKYDKKMQKRREEALREARAKFITRCVIIGVIVAAIIVGCVAAVLNYNKIYKEYIVVDGKSMSQVEFDFYYGITKNTALSTTLYGEMTYGDYYKQYLGYDTSKKDSGQSYSSDSDYTWYDYFANQTVDAIKENKALIAAAEENDYSFDTIDDDYDEFVKNLKDAANEADKSYKSYIKELFGKHATAANIKGYIKNYLKGCAYQEYLTEKLAATEDEIKEYYNNNKESYDEITYRTYEIEAESNDTTAMAEAKSRAESFIATATSETAFAENCRGFALTDDAKTAYESDDASLKSAAKNDIEEACQEWLNSDARVLGDTTVIEDTTNACYYCLYYIRKEYDGSYDDSIANTILSNKYTEYISAYTDKIEINVKKRFSYSE